MTDTRRSLEEQVEILNQQVHDLGGRLEILEARLEAGVKVSPALKGEASKGAGAAETSEKVLSWMGQSSLLQRLSTLCFLLVVALVLRTATDNQMLDKEAGSLIGMIYAFALIGWGWRGYRRESPLAPVFTICGAFLVFSVVVETHEHFGSLSTVPAYLIIATAGVMLAAISHLHRVALPVFVGTLGMCFAGIALDFPNPIFPYLFVLLVAANALGAFATRLQRCSWLRWMLFLVTVGMIQIWAFRLGIFLAQGNPSDLPFSVAWFFPAVVTLALVYMGTALLGIRGRLTERVSKFDFALPALNVLWAFTAARYAVNAGLGSEALLGAGGLVGAVLHLGIAFWLGKRVPDGAVGTNSFVLPAALLLAMALPITTGSRPLALAALSALAFGMVIWSRKWRSGGMRATSYALQVYACAILALLLRATEGTAPSLLGAGASGALAGLAFFHYLWSRNNPPPAESAFFSRFDRTDRSAVLLLISALVGGFFTLRIGIYQGLSMFVAGEALASAFAGAQTVLINVSATVLMCFALAWRNKEIRNVAILVTVIGGIKVFLVDLFGLQGVPVVVSVLSFGIAASLESFALSRWQRIDRLRYSKWPRETGREHPQTGNSE